MAVLALVAAVPAAAQTVVFNQGPTTGSNGGCWANHTDGQNFADKATLAATTPITAVGIFTCTPPLTGHAHVKILADNGADQPGSVLYSEDKVPDSWAFDTDSGGFKVRVVLTTPFSAQAGVTYWYGVSGNSDMSGDLAQYTVQNPGDGRAALFAGTAFVDFATSSGGYIGDQMFQLEGPVAEAIPALGDFGLLALALLLAAVGVVAIRRFV